MGQNDIVEVTLDLGEGKVVTLRGPEQFVRQEVRHLAGIQPLDSGARSAGAPSQDERRLLAEKRPRNHAETVTVLGYFLTQAGHAEFSEADIRKAYLRAGQRPPKYVGQALRDARSKFDLIEGGSKRGLYRISPHGERTVLFDLPVDSGKVE